MNAFAAGYSPSDAAVAVTRGALEKLNRDELQGVIAHEFRHILNGDMRLNIRLIGVLFGNMVMGNVGRRLLLHGGMSRNSRDGVALLQLVALVVIVSGYRGLLCGRVVQDGFRLTRPSPLDTARSEARRSGRGCVG